MDISAEGRMFLLVVHALTCYYLSAGPNLCSASEVRRYEEDCDPEMGPATVTSSSFLASLIVFVKHHVQSIQACFTEELISFRHMYHVTFGGIVDNCLSLVRLYLISREVVVSHVICE